MAGPSAGGGVVAMALPAVAASRGAANSRATSAPKLAMPGYALQSVATDNSVPGTCTR